MYKGLLLPSCFSIQILEQLPKFLVNVTLLKYVKSQRNYGFLNTKELIFGFQILDLKDHFSASLTVPNFKLVENILHSFCSAQSCYDLLILGSSLLQKFRDVHCCKRQRSYQLYAKQNVSRICSTNSQLVHLNLK